jgi:hypothetical protein
LLFGVLQHFAHRRLRHVQQLGGATDRTGLANSLKNLDVSQSHGKSITFVYGSGIFMHCSTAVTWS